MIEENHVWERKRNVLYMYGDLKKHYITYYYKCADCGVTISEDTYNKLEDK